MPKQREWKNMGIRFQVMAVLVGRGLTATSIAKFLKSETIAVEPGNVYNILLKLNAEGFSSNSAIQRGA